jgi:predicted PurR-regulated permease PerM
MANSPIKGGDLSRPYTFDRVVRIIITLCALAGAVWLINELRSVLLPFMVSWLIAYLLEPFVQYNRRLLRCKGRAVPVFVTLFEFILIVVFLGVLFIPSIINEMHQAAALVSRYASGAGQIPMVPQAFHDFLRKYIDFETISTQLTHQDWQTLLDAVGGVLSSGLSFIISIINWFIAVLYVVFIMLDYNKLIESFKHIVIPKYRSVVFKIWNDVTDSMNHYFRGQALVAFLVGVLFCIGFSIIGLPLALPLGMFIGLLNLVPYLQLISIIPTTLLCVVYSVDSSFGFWEVWWACMAVYIVVQCIQDLVLTPKIMGNAMGLNPAIILLSLSVWGTLLGFIGLIIALPLTTLILAYYNQYIATPKIEASDEVDDKPETSKD